MQAILTASQAGVQYGNEVGFGVSVAMSGNIFAVGSLGASDVTGQLQAGIGNLYVFILQAPAGGTTGASSAFSTPLSVQVIPAMPVSNAMAISMAGNYLCVGVQQRSQVVVMLTSPVTTANPIPNYNRQTVVGGTTSSKGTGMGQIVVGTMIDGLLYVYMGQPNSNIGAIFVSTRPQTVTLADLGVQAGLEPGFGTSIAWNTRDGGNYLFAGNFINNPHALVISLYYETLGKGAAGQRLISNDVQTSNTGVFSNYGSVVTGQTNSAGSIIAVGASLGPSLMGRVFIYSLRRDLSPPSFSLQAELTGSPGCNFGASVGTMLSQGSDMAIVVGAPSTTGATVSAYVDIFIANAAASQVLPSMLAPGGGGIQRLMAPPCIPLTDTFSCGANFGGAVVVDGTRIVVGAHNFGVQPGTGRVYVYIANLLMPRSSMFSLQQILFSPASDFGFGVGIALGNVMQNSNTPPVQGAQIDTSTAGNGAQTQTINMLYVAAMGQPRIVNPNYPFNQPQGVGATYVYVNIGMANGNGQPYSMLQVLQNAPVQITSNLAGTGAAQSIVAQGNDLFIGTVLRNEVRFYRYNGVAAYSLMQTLVSPYGGNNDGQFGCSLFATPSNRGLIVGTVRNGTVFLYTNPQPTNSAGRYNLIRVLSAMPTADQFGASVSSSGDNVIVGAPGANVATLFPLTRVMLQPQAQLTINPTRRPTSRPSPSPTPTVRNPSVARSAAPSVPGAPTVPVGLPTRAPIQPTPAPSTSSLPTAVPSQTPFPTPEPTGFPVFSRYTERILTPLYARSSFGPCDITFLFQPNLLMPTPAPTPVRVAATVAEEAKVKVPASKSAMGRVEREHTMVVGSTSATADESSSSSSSYRTLRVKANASSGKIEIPVEELQAAIDAETERSLSGGGPGNGQYMVAGQPTPSPVMSILGFYGQQRFTQLGYWLASPATPRTKYYLDIDMAGTGWGGNSGQYIKFYATMDSSAPGEVVTCGPLDSASPSSFRTKPTLSVVNPSNVCMQQGGVSCTGKLDPITGPFTPPSSGMCSQSLSDWMSVAVDIEVSKYITAPTGGSLILTYITTGLDQSPATITCPYKDSQSNSVFFIAVRYRLKSVNPWPTAAPTFSSQEALLLSSAASSYLAPGFSVYVICILLGTIIWTVLGFRLTIVRSNAKLEGITPINGLGTCLYLSTVGTSFIMDLALAGVCLEAEWTGMHMYGVAILIARLLMIFPSIYVVSKVYQEGSYEDQLDELHMEANSMTYAFFSLFMLVESQLLVYYPWKATEFTKASNGYPDFERMRMAHYPKIVSTLIILSVTASLLTDLKNTWASSGTQKNLDMDNLIAFVTLALVYTVCLFVSLIIELATHLKLSKYGEGKEDIMDFKKHNKKGKKGGGSPDGASVYGGGSVYGGDAAPAVGEYDGSPPSVRGRANSVRASMAQRASVSPQQLPPHMLGNSGFVPRLSSGSFSGHPGMVYPPPPMGPPGSHMSMPLAVGGGGGPRFMPPGAIHPPMGSPSAPGTRRQSTGPSGGALFQKNNPPPPMNGGGRKASINGRPGMPQPRERFDERDL